MAAKFFVHTMRMDCIALPYIKSWMCHWVPTSFTFKLADYAAFPSQCCHVPHLVILEIMILYDTSHLDDVTWVEDDPLI